MFDIIYNNEIPIQQDITNRLQTIEQNSKEFITVPFPKIKKSENTFVNLYKTQIKNAIKELVEMKMVKHYNSNLLIRNKGELREYWKVFKRNLKDYMNKSIELFST